jgi:signal transduction histidine kinase
MRERSVSPDQQLSEFLLHVCHDLKAPVRAIRTHAELLVKNGSAPPNSPFHASLGFMVDGAKRIDLLAEGLASYSIALQMDGSSFQPTRLDVLLRTVLAHIARELDDHKAEVTYGELPRVAGDPDRLMQVFENLLRNALYHGGQRAPAIRITAAEQGDYWLFAVKDNGVGMEASDLECIFQPFVRLSGQACPPGPGLGLAICRAIVERHGGRIWAESATGSGATFFFTLPRSS